MNDVFLLLGGNLGHTRSYFSEAEYKIGLGVGEIVGESSLYESPAWGFEHENTFLNKVICVNSQFKPVEVLRKCISIEQELGRERNLSIGYSARKIDIDMLFYNNEIIKTKELTVPHPRLHQRRFTLLPLVEIAENLIHPIFKKTVLELLSSCSDDSKVEKI